MLRPLFHRLQKSARRVREKWKLETTIHPAIQRYMRYCRQTWPRDPVASRDSVVLVGLFQLNNFVHSYAHVANALARRTGSSIEWFYGHRHRNRLYEKIYAAFGARRAFCMDDLRTHHEAAEKLASEWFAGLKTKWDLIKLSVDGIQIGDLIYDTYMRSRFLPTVDIADPHVREIMVHAAEIYLGTKEYLARKKVVGVFADHNVYIYCGLVVRMAVAAGIPVYLVLNQPTLQILTADRSESDVPLSYPWPRYADLFRRLDPQVQVQAREKGRQSLEARLEGRKDGVLFDSTAYGGTGGERIFEKTGRPRMLVLLNDFFDAVHVYRWMLFPDFYEWAHFILGKASETSFDWYVKPHPNILMWERWNYPKEVEANRKVVAELREKYPKMRFLSPSVSNRQIMEEGVDALFTVHGTAGHEFAYRGVPVVNAGDNQHIAYPFNIHPRTIAEYEDCVAHADRLKIDIRKDDIGEYVYMNYIYSREQCGSDVHLVPESYFETAEYREGRPQPETFDSFCEPLAAGDRTKFEAYCDRIFHRS